MIAGRKEEIREGGREETETQGVGWEEEGKLCQEKI